MFVPTKMRPDDWDRLFAPNAPRRGGPLHAFVNVVLVFIMFLVVGVAGVYAVRYRDHRTATMIATATSFAATQQPLQTATAQAKATTTAAQLAQRTSTAQEQATSAAILGRGTVQKGGNLRREPRVADDTVIGLIWPGDQVEFLKQELVGGQTWFQIRVVKAADDRGGQGVSAGTDGWASSVLLSPPQQ
ncbi:MAG TPA: SH3 domain-containing protein [Roseiflexaceae bacterium]|jgi:hypothetical protein|nr:SH3 domain-containing protein [Roseiflexaceae bacterium]